jgi:hypothetical protein
MKNLCLKFLLVFVVQIQINAQQNKMIQTANNFTSFTSKNTTNISDELNELTPNPYKNNPDFGVLPLNSPCENCFELIHKRTEYERHFVSGNKIFVQKGYNKINYVDENGNLRERISKLFPIGNGLFTSIHQPEKTEIDTINKTISLYLNNKKISFLNNLCLIFEDSLGNRSLLDDTPDWSNTSVGSDGILIKNIFNNIDFEAVAFEGSFKTSFIINENPQLDKSGWLIFSDSLTSNFNHNVSFENPAESNGKFNCNLNINDSFNQKTFSFLQGICSSQNRFNSSALYYQLLNNKFEQHISTSWLVDTSTVYPISVDPVVTNSNTLLQASISGSGLNNTGSFVGFCPYNLSVPRPANTTLNNVLWTFSYIAQNGARRNEGAVRFTTGACISPSTTGFFWFCNVNTAGVCTGSNVAIGNDLLPCISPLSACNGSVTFTMQFFDRFAGAACSNLFIGAFSDWTMTLVGNTLETLGNSTSGNGTTTVTATCYTPFTLNPSVSNGVPGYSYLWSPGGETTPTKSLFITTLPTQTHVVTVTDACGVSRVATFIVNNTCVLPITLKNYFASFNGKSVDLFWETASERNSDYFTIEKSTNAIDYELLTTVKAAGNSSTLKNYKAIDYNPEKGTVIYYRLRQYDFNNNQPAFEHVITVTIEEKDINLLLMPNPTNKQLDLTLTGTLKGLPISIDIFDFTGKSKLFEIFESKDNAFKHSLNLENFQAGIYYVKVNYNGNSYTAKVIKN